MGEIKSVKVDNWGVFFLQKLQNFFNKTDFCDLTLQFRDNSQLKVHRLVLSACTDFFNVLEQTCELMDDALVMPAELQADVVVPIVNFMYTGTLEFELKMYGKLLKTAKEMNMTVLLKLLEAHKRTMETSRTVAKATGQIMKNKQKYQRVGQTPQTVSSTQQQPQHIQITTHQRTPAKRVSKQDKITYKQESNTLVRCPPKLQRGPIRFEEPNTQTETYESSFDSISYESKPLKEEPEEYNNDMQSSNQWNRSSPFEQLRKGFNNNKRPAVATFTSPPAKKPNIEDVKEFSEQQRMRKQIAAEFGDDAEFDSIMDDEFHHDDDDEEPLNTSASSSSVAVKQEQHQQQQQSSIIIKHSPNEKPTIVVKDSSNSKMDHAKIISEVLRQYPHLVKSNKNIKLKIMPNVGGQAQKIMIKKETIDNMSTGLQQGNESEKTQSKQQKVQSIIKKPVRVNQTKVETQTKSTTITASKNSNEIKAPPGPNTTTQKRRIDSKTMHALIAQGAENTTGPWLCLRCGVNGRPISIPSYRGFRRHLINTHKETIDPALCEYCGWRSKHNRELHYHLFMEHKVESLLYTFPECKECHKICINENDLQKHFDQYHPDSHKQQCIYCNKVFNKEINLYNHMKTFHKKRAREDGVIDFSDEEMDMELERKPSNPESKIKILSDIALPSTLLNLEEQRTSIEEEEYANDSGPKFVNADGNEMLLTAEQREEIMSQLDQDHEGGVVMVLNESVFPPEDATDAAEDDTKSKSEARENIDEYEDQSTEFLTEGDADIRETETSMEESAVDANKDEENDDHEQHESDNDERLDDEDHMEWAENLISAHDNDEDDNVNDAKVKHDNDSYGGKSIKDETEDVNKDTEEQNIGSTKSVKGEKSDVKKNDDIHLKLKMLTGDWTDDEIDEEEENNEEKSQQIKDENAEEFESEMQNVEELQKSKVYDTDSKKQEEASHELGIDTEPEAESSLIAEDEFTQSSHSEKVAKDESEEKLEDNSDLVKIEEEFSEADNSATKSDETRKDNQSAEGRTSRRTSLVKDKDAHRTDELSETNDAKMDCNKKEQEEKEKSPVNNDDIKETETPEGTSTKSTSEELSKTPDKVKSLLNEWADDDDDL